jgi:hypothetical protein
VFDLHNHTKQCEIKFPDKYIGKESGNFIYEHIVFKEGDLANMLGQPGEFLVSNNFGDEFPNILPLPVDIELIHSLSIYADVIEYSVIGDTQAPILRSVPFANKSESQRINNLTFPEPLQYRNVLKNSFQSIRIELRQPNGKLVPFSGIGVTRLTLHFREVSSHLKNFMLENGRLLSKSN